MRQEVAEQNAAAGVGGNVDAGIAQVVREGGRPRDAERRVQRAVCIVPGHRGARSLWPVVGNERQKRSAPAVNRQAYGRAFAQPLAGRDDATGAHGWIQLPVEIESCERDNA